MNEASGIAVGWTRKRWLTFVAMATLAQLAGILLLSERNTGIESFKQERAFLTLSTGGRGASHPPLAATMADPALFALVHPKGFSADAWLRSAPSQHELAEWNEPAHLLNVGTQTLAVTVSEYIRSNPPPQIRLTGRLDAELGPLPDSVVPLPRKSSIRIIQSSGGLEPLATPQVTTPVSAEPLPPTRVRATIDERGEVISTTLLARSGNAKADQQALGVAREMRFTTGKVSAKTPGWVVMEFRWTTVMPVQPASSSATP